MADDRAEQLIDGWIRSQGCLPLPVQGKWPVLYDEKGIEWFVKCAGRPHPGDPAGTGLCTVCSRRSFVWAVNIFFGRRCLLCFQRGEKSEKTAVWGH